VFKVSGKSNVVKTSDAISKSVIEGDKIEVQAIGAGAVNQAAKSIAAASGKLASQAKFIVSSIGFRNIQIKDVGERTLIVYKLMER
jgi:stage V sporulation protein S